MTSGRSRALLHAGATTLLATITWLDHLTGYDFGFISFYFLPVAMVAWYGTRRAALLIALAAGGCWYLVDLSSHHPGLQWEALANLLSLLVAALLLAQVRADLTRREQFLDVVSHDLRAPLGALVGQAQVLRKKVGGDAFVAARVESILRCASRMNGTIEDLLDSARKESNQLDLRLEPVDVGAYLAELLDRCEAVLEVDRVRLRRDGARGPFVRADPGRLERIVLNLIINALKYSPPGSPVEVGAVESGDRVTLSVADRGPGIPTGDFPHLFERFFRGERTAARGGLGIGLYSVRLLVEAHGGTVRVERGSGGGSTFLVELPAWHEPACGPVHGGPQPAAS